MDRSAVLRGSQAPQALLSFSGVGIPTLEAIGAPGAVWAEERVMRQITAAPRTPSVCRRRGWKLRTTSMCAHVVGMAGMNHEVFRPVVQLVPIEMVYDLVSTQRPSEELGHDVAVLENVLSIDGNLPVAVKGDHAGAVSRARSRGPILAN